MNGFDILLIVIIVGAMLIGMLKGIVRLAVGLLALMAAFTVAAAFHLELAVRVGGDSEPSSVARLVAWAALFFGVMFAGSLVAWALRNLVKAAMLGWADRLAGAALGALAAIMLSAFLLVPLVAYMPDEGAWLRGSRLVPFVVSVADVLHRIVPEELSERFEEGLREWEREWRVV